VTSEGRKDRPVSVAKTDTYLSGIIENLKRQWPDNRTVNIVCHGHSVPAGYFATPFVDTFNAYPHLLHKGLKERFPFAVINIIVSAVGGENSELGALRYRSEVLCHRPDVVTLDYGLNDRKIGFESARRYWGGMIEDALGDGIKVILLTPTSDATLVPGYEGEDREALAGHAEQIRALAAEYEVGLADSFAAFNSYAACGKLADLMSWSNHPNRAGHAIVSRELMRWFPLV